MKKIQILFIIGLLFNSCTKTLDDIDKDPNNPTDTSIKSLLTSVTTGIPYNVVGTDLSWYTSIFCEQTAGVHGQMLNTELRTEGVLGNSYNNSWLFIYPRMLKDIDVILQKSEKENNKITLGVGKILKVFCYSILVDLFGEIPYSEALKFPEIKLPKYDKQEDIYLDLLNTLDEAISNIEENIGFIGKEDQIFDGDKAKWKKTAYGLKARIMNRIIGKIGSFTDNNIIEAVDKSFSDSNEEFKFSKFSSGLGWQNTWYAEENQRSHHSISQTFYNLLNSSSDPRLPLCIDDSKVDASKPGYSMTGKPSGGSINDQGKALYPTISSKVLTAFSDMPMITYSELQFIKAEAILRGGTGTLKDAFENGVKASMKRFGVEDAEIITYLGTIPTPGLKNIIEEKYKSSWPFNSIEAYSEYRRTGFPSLSNPLNSQGKFPQRLPYPDYELNTNPNTPKDIDIFNIPLIWATKR